MSSLTEARGGEGGREGKGGKGAWGGAADTQPFLTPGAARAPGRRRFTVHSQASVFAASAGGAGVSLRKRLILF